MLDSLTTARQKASKGQIFSDVSSADDDILTRKERKKKLSPSLSPERPKKKPSHTITSQSLWDSSGKLINLYIQLAEIIYNDTCCIDISGFMA